MNYKSRGNYTTGGLNISQEDWDRIFKKVNSGDACKFMIHCEGKEFNERSSTCGACVEETLKQFNPEGDI